MSISISLSTVSITTFFSISFNYIMYFSSILERNPSSIAAGYIAGYKQDTGLEIHDIRYIYLYTYVI